MHGTGCSLQGLKLSAGKAKWGPAGTRTNSPQLPHTCFTGLAALHLFVAAETGTATTVNTLKPPRIAGRKSSSR